MNKAMITFVLCCCMISCIKDEAPNNECDIESAWVEGAELEKLFYKPADMRKENISSTETSITFRKAQSLTPSPLRTDSGTVHTRSHLQSPYCPKASSRMRMLIRWKVVS